MSKLITKTAQEVIENKKVIENKIYTVIVQPAKEELKTTDWSTLKKSSEIISKPVEFFIHDINPERGMFALGKTTIIFGNPGSGKSMWGLDLAHKITTNNTIMSDLKVNSKIKNPTVLYVCGDENISFYKSRLEYSIIRQTDQYVSDNLLWLDHETYTEYKPEEQFIDLGEKKCIESLMELIEYYEIDMLFLDTLSGLTISDTYREETLKKIILSLKTLNKKFTKLSIILFHHGTKTAYADIVNTLSGSQVLSRLSSEIYFLNPCDFDKNGESLGAVITTAKRNFKQLGKNYKITWSNNNKNEYLIEYKNTATPLQQIENYIEFNFDKGEIVKNKKLTEKFPNINKRIISTVLKDLSEFNKPKLRKVKDGIWEKL